MRWRDEGPLPRPPLPRRRVPIGMRQTVHAFAIGRSLSRSPSGGKAEIGLGVQRDVCGRLQAEGSRTDWERSSESEIDILCL